MKKIVARMFVFSLVLCAAGAAGWRDAWGGESHLQSGGSDTLVSKERDETNDPDEPFTVSEFYAQQVRQFQAMRPVMEQEMAENLLPTSPIYQKMLQMNQLSASMLEELAALTAEDKRSIAAMMDPSSDLYGQIAAIQQKYEPQMNQLQMELAPYMGMPGGMSSHFGGPMSPHGNVPGAGPGGAGLQEEHPQSHKPPHEEAHR